MAFKGNVLGEPSSAVPLLDNEYNSSGSDSDDTARLDAVSRASATGSSGSPHAPDFLFANNLSSGRSSTSSSSTSTPVPSRSNSPLPQFFSSNASSCTSDTDSEPMSPFMRSANGQWWREDRRRWWGLYPRRRRKRDGRAVRFLRKWSRKIVRHPFFPQQPFTIVSLFRYYIALFSLPLVI